MKKLLTILFIVLTISSYAQVYTIKIGGVDTAAMLLPYKNNYPRQAITLTTFGTTGLSTYSKITGILNIPQEATNGQFTSAAAGVTNVTSTNSSPIVYWTKINGQVHGSIFANVTPTATGLTEVSFTLPSTTSLGAGALIGAGVSSQNGGTAIVPAYVYISNSSTVIVRFYSTVAASGSYYVSLDYRE